MSIKLILFFTARCLSFVWRLILRCLQEGQVCFCNPKSRSLYFSVQCHSHSLSDHFPVTELKRVNRLDSLQHLPSSRKVPNRLCIIWLQSPEWSQLMIKLMGNEDECTAAAELCPFNNTQATSNHFLSAEMKLPPRQNMEEHLSPLFYKCSTTSQVGREWENIHQDWTSASEIVSCSKPQQVWH